jgi:hypothetical protein
MELAMETKTNYLFRLSVAIIFYLLLITSCDSGNAPEISSDPLFPTQVGNIWYFERFEVNSKGEIVGDKVYTDSLVITGKSIIGDKQSYLITFYREGDQTHSGYLFCSSGQIQLYSTFLIPLAPVDTTKCYTALTKQWQKICDLRESKWKITDSIPDLRPTLISDEKGDYKTEVNLSAYLVDIEGSLANIVETKINGETRKGFQFCFKGGRIFRIITPGNLKLRKSDELEYFDNDRAVFLDKINLYITYTPGIGITEIFEDYAYGPHPKRYISKLKSVKLR